MDEFLLKLWLILLPGFYWTTYTIEKDRHYSKHELVSYKEGNVLRFDVKFMPSCIYEPTAFEGDLNKLYGWVDCGSTIHANSARFAWRHNGDGMIEVWCYLYIDSVRVMFPVGETKPKRRDEYEIHIEADRYYMRFNNTDTTLFRGRKCNYIKERARAYPYFGGDLPAPHKMKIKVHEFRKLKIKENDFN